MESGNKILFSSVSRSPRTFGKVNIINLAIGAQISKEEEAAQVAAIRAEQARLQEQGIVENEYSTRRSGAAVTHDHTATAAGN